MNSLFLFPSADSTSSLLMPPDSPAVTSGFGTVLQAEHLLSSAIEAAVATLEGIHALPVARILREHLVRVSTVAAALEASYQRLPLPQRFLALKAGIPVRTHGRTNPLPRVALEPLGQLAEAHERLARQLANLAQREQSGDASLGDVFGHASRQHEAMGGTLHAVVSQNAADLRAGAAAPTAPALPDPQAQRRESRWENEGGAQGPPA